MPRAAELIALALVLYGGMTFAFFVYGGLTGSWRSPFLAGLALACGVLAIATGLLLRARSLRARLALIGLATALFALNGFRIASDGTLGGAGLASILALGGSVEAVFVVAMYRYMGRVCVPPGRDGPPLVASR